MEIQRGVDILEAVALHHLSGCIGRRLRPTDHQDRLVAIQRHERLHDGVRLNDLILCHGHLELSCEVPGTRRLVLSSAIGDEDVGDLLISWIVSFEYLKRSLRFRKYVGPGFEYTVDVKCESDRFLQVGSVRETRG